MEDGPPDFFGAALLEPAVPLRVNGEWFHVHRVVLLKIPFIADLLVSGESHPEVQLPCSAPEFSLLLQRLYTGERLGSVKLPVTCLAAANLAATARKLLITSVLPELHSASYDVETAQMPRVAVRGLRDVRCRSAHDRRQASLERVSILHRERVQRAQQRWEAKQLTLSKTSESRSHTIDSVRQNTQKRNRRREQRVEAFRETERRREELRFKTLEETQLRLSERALRAKSAHQKVSNGRSKAASERLGILLSNRSALTDQQEQARQAVAERVARKDASAEARRLAQRSRSSGPPELRAVREVHRQRAMRLEGEENALRKVEDKFTCGRPVTTGFIQTENPRPAPPLVPPPTRKRPQCLAAAPKVWASLPDRGELEELEEPEEPEEPEAESALVCEDRPDLLAVPWPAFAALNVSAQSLNFATPEGNADASSYSKRSDAPDSSLDAVEVTFDCAHERARTAPAALETAIPVSEGGDVPFDFLCLPHADLDEGWIQSANLRDLAENAAESFADVLLWAVEEPC